MPNDLATQSLGPTNRVTLAERRQLYADWLASGRKIPPSTGIAYTRVDDVEAKRPHNPSELGTLNPMPPGAVVRTDDGGTPDAQVSPSDDVRLDFAKALLPKAEGADPATAAIVANAATAMLGPMVRADDDADVKSKVLEKKADDEEKGEPDKDKVKARKAPDDDDEEQDNEPTLATVMAALKGLHKRMDKIEAKKKAPPSEEEDDSGSVDVPTRGASGPEGMPKELAADDALYRSDALRRRTQLERMDKEIHSWKNQDRFAEFQSRADQVSQLFGKSAAPPMAGETLGAYKRRTVREWQKFSPAFKNSDLKVLQVADGVAFNVAIEDIMARADKEGRNPSQIPLGYLVERTETKGGHQHTKFYGRPMSWMAPFMVQGKRVRKIIERSDSGTSRTLYERQ